MQTFDDYKMSGEGVLSSETLARQLLPHLLLSAPLLIAVPFAFAVGFNGLERGRLSLLPFCVGALGWLAALLLRAPLFLLGFRLNKTAMESLMATAAGPCEEAVRLAAVLLIGSGFSTAFSLGLGWAAVEILYTLIQGFASFLMLSKGGALALQVKMKFLEMGQTVEASIYWGVAERLSATAFHIGLTLLVAYNPLLILVTMPLHSAVNASAVRLMRRSIVAVQIIVCLVGAATLLTGIALLG